MSPALAATVERTGSISADRRAHLLYRTSLRSDPQPVPHPRLAMSAQTSPLTMAVVRLLSIALEASAPDCFRAIAGPALPKDFHVWPYHEAALDPVTVLRCYVSPRTMMAEEPRTFPVGTTLVVERRVMGLLASSKRRSSDARIEARFVMVKCATVTAGIGGDHDVWMHANYRAADMQRPASRPLCGVVRVSVADCATGSACL